MQNYSHAWLVVQGSTAATPNCLKCLDALVHVETSDDKDDLELLLLQSLFASTNFEQLMARGMRVVEVLKTGAAQRDPISSTLMSQMLFLPQVSEYAHRKL